MLDTKPSHKQNTLSRLDPPALSSSESCIVSYIRFFRIGPYNGSIEFVHDNYRIFADHPPKYFDMTFIKNKYKNKVQTPQTIGEISPLIQRDNRTL